MRYRATGIVVSLALQASTAYAQNLPAEAVRNTGAPEFAHAMLSAARQGGVEEIRIVARAARQVYPAYAAAIDLDAAIMIAEILGTQPPAGAPNANAPTAYIQPTNNTPDAPPIVANIASPPEEDVDGAEQESGQKGGLTGLWAWTGEFTAGATIASGNSDNVATGLGLDANLEGRLLTHHVKAGFDIASSAGRRTQKRWLASYQMDVSFTDKTYGYWRFSYEEDEFSGFDYRLFTGAGFGAFVFKSDPLTLKVEGGPGYRFSPIDDSNESESEAAAYAEVSLNWLLRKGVRFKQDMNGTWTDRTSTITAVSALTTDLTRTISTGLSFQVRYETAPPEGRENTDTLFKANIKYGF